ncbi:Ppx/GppA phosphatase family protein [Solwaraspora sp. WMMD406]|uniref:Ppx/GppA phosphatase family protein n=1 Tax=Solwaraspora sp. WMMD406 TaxID=3016095 RepID=UPI002416D202|nr:Ppx/GppA phosphatase family protein [Solwaraspora sp. WMMD406]MDG4763831.1 Ppx/GppA phosphatase family protein [Solwaraspora sp. WMMD406]
MAGIDCGTNSIRLLVADLAAGGAGAPAAEQLTAEPLTDVVRRMEIVRLGEGVDQTRRLAPAAIERTRRALVGYAAEIDSLGVDRVRMCATSASRDASNAADFVAMVEATLGITPEVLTGDEEARLTFAGAVGGLAGTARPPYLVVDIGGGSTEFVRGTDGVDQAVSVDIGCVRMTERHLTADPPTAEQIQAAQRDVADAVDRALAAVRPSGPAVRPSGPADAAGPSDPSGPVDSAGPTGLAGSAADVTLVGLAGSVTTVAGIALGLDEYRPELLHHATISYDAVAEVTADLLAMPVARRLGIPVMHPGRADVIAAGALVLRTIMERAGVSSVVASEHDILDGICLSLR